MGRVCKKCGNEKDISQFHKCKKLKDGYSYVCAECTHEIDKIYHNKPSYKERKKKWGDENRDKVLRNKRKYNKTNKKKECDKRYLQNNPEKFLESQNKYKQSAKYKERYNARKAGRIERDKERRANEPDYKIKFNLRVRVNKAVKAQGAPRFYRYDEYIGCTPAFLRVYLESMFKDGMSWANNSNKGWHIDHIIPCDSFNFHDPEQQKQCFHYTNLQPLWWYENMSKGAKIVA